jgi:hypothetical protein
MMSMRSVSALKELVRCERSALVAYEDAIRACDVPEVRGKLSEFSAEHAELLRQLETVAFAAGCSWAGTSSVRPWPHEIAAGDRAALLAMLGNERVARRRFAEVREGELEGEVDRLVTEGLREQERHLAWIDAAIASRVWQRAA